MVDIAKIFPGWKMCLAFCYFSMWVWYLEINLHSHATELFPIVAASGHCDAWWVFCMQQKRWRVAHDSLGCANHCRSSLTCIVSGIWDNIISTNRPLTKNDTSKMVRSVETCKNTRLCFVSWGPSWCSESHFVACGWNHLPPGTTRWSVCPGAPSSNNAWQGAKMNAEWLLTPVPQMNKWTNVWVPISFDISFKPCRSCETKEEPWKYTGWSVVRVFLIASSLYIWVRISFISSQKRSSWILDSDVGLWQGGHSQTKGLYCREKRDHLLRLLRLVVYHETYHFYLDVHLHLVSVYSPWLYRLFEPSFRVNHHGLRELYPGSTWFFSGVSTVPISGFLPTAAANPLTIPVPSCHAEGEVSSVVVNGSIGGCKLIPA